MITIKVMEGSFIVRFNGVLGGGGAVTKPVINKISLLSFKIPNFFCATSDKMILPRQYPILFFLPLTPCFKCAARDFNNQPTYLSPRTLLQRFLSFVLAQQHFDPIIGGCKTIKVYHQCPRIRLDNHALGKHNKQVFWIPDNVCRDPDTVDHLDVDPDLAF